MLRIKLSNWICFTALFKKKQEEEEDSFVRYYHRDLFVNIFIMLQCDTLPVC